MSQWRGHTVATTFFLRSQFKSLPDMCRLSWDDFYVSTGQMPQRFENTYRCFPGARERYEKRVVVVPVYGVHFEQEFRQFWAQQISYNAFRRALKRLLFSIWCRLPLFALLWAPANYWQTRSIARPLCDSRATCVCTEVKKKHKFLVSVKLIVNK